MRIKLLVRLAALILIVVALYLLLWPVPVSPVAWTPPPAPQLAGVFAPNNRLSGIQRLPTDGGFGPEDVALDSRGRIYTGMDNGRIVRLNANGSAPEGFANTHGRPLGLVFDRSDNLIVADAIKGLLSIAPDGSITVLSTQADGVSFGCTNDLDVAGDGTIYFTDAS